MKLLLKLFIAFIMMFTNIGVVGVGRKERKADDIPAAAGVSSFVAMDVYSKRTLFEENGSAKRYPASLTKTLTAICAIENKDINSEVVINKSACGIEGSSIYLKEGETYTLKSLLYGLMLRSGNDAATAVAEYVSGSVKDFADLMNKTALKAGAENSNFTNPHGLHDENHYSTAYDMALISAYALKNETFAEIVKTKSIRVTYKDSLGEEKVKVFINKNKMLSMYDGADGVKTGFTKNSGRCLISSATRGGFSVVTVVLNTYDMWGKSKQLLDSSFNNYERVTVAKSDEMIAFSDIEGETEKCGLYIKNDIILPLTKEEKESLKVEKEYPSSLKLPIKKDEPVGKIKIYALNKLIFEEKIYTIIEKK